MKSKQTMAALVAAASLLWGSAHAAPEAGEQGLEGPGVVILELQAIIPGIEAGSEQEQALMGMLLLQLLAAMQAESESVEVPLTVPVVGERI
jgi:hypothetical protein